MMWYDMIWQTRTYKCNIARRVTHGKHPVSHHSFPNDFIMAHPAFASFEATLAASGTHHNIFCSHWWWVFCTLIIIDTLQSKNTTIVNHSFPKQNRLGNRKNTPKLSLFRTTFLCVCVSKWPPWQSPPVYESCSFSTDHRLDAFL